MLWMLGPVVTRRGVLRMSIVMCSCVRASRVQCTVFACPLGFMRSWDRFFCDSTLFCLQYDVVVLNDPNV